MMRRQIKTLAIAAALAAAGLGTAAVITACGTSGQTSGTAASASPPAGTQARAQDAYSYYRSMMGRYFGGSMMGGGARGWMMSPAGYRWMTGSTDVPGWMRGGHFPAYMMGSGMMGTGTSADPGKFMGRLWAGAPGPRVTPAQAARAGNQIPPGAHIDQAARTITFTTGSVHLAAVASPAGGPDETFRIAGTINPRITVPAGARSGIQVINPRSRHRLRPGYHRRPGPVPVDADADRPACVRRLSIVGPRQPSVAGIHVLLARPRRVQAGGGGSQRRCSRSPCSCHRRQMTADGEIWLAWARAARRCLVRSTRMHRSRRWGGCPVNGWPVSARSRSAMAAGRAQARTGSPVAVAARTAARVAAW